MGFRAGWRADGVLRAPCSVIQAARAFGREMTP